MTLHVGLYLGYQVGIQQSQTTDVPGLVQVQRSVSQGWFYGLSAPGVLRGRGTEVPAGGLREGWALTFASWRGSPRSRDVLDFLLPLAIREDLLALLLAPCRIW